VSVVGAPAVVVVVVIEDVVDGHLLVVDVVHWHRDLLVVDVVHGNLLVDGHWHVLHHRHMDLLDVVVMHCVHLVRHVDGVVLAVDRK